MKSPEEMAAPPTPRPRVVRLETARDCRKFLARLVNRAYRDEIDAGKAGRLGYLVGIILKSIEIHDLEKRIEGLEAQTRVR